MAAECHQIKFHRNATATIALKRMASPKATYPLQQRTSSRRENEAVDRLVRLLTWIAKGDHAAFHSLYDSTSAKLFATISRIVANRAEAEDVLQDAYIRVWEKAGSYDASRGGPMSWLITIARHGALDRKRRGAGRVMIDLEQAGELRDPLPTADVVVFASRDAERLTAVLDNLPAHVAATIRSAYFDDCSYAELATNSGIAVGTMKSWVRRGLVQMRSQLAVGSAEFGTHGNSGSAHAGRSDLIHLTPSGLFSRSTA